MWRFTASSLSSALCLIVLATTPPASRSLKQAADDAHILVGTAVRPSVFSEPAYSETLAREFNMVEAEDAMEWWIVRRNPTGFDFRDGDQVVEYAHTA